MSRKKAALRSAGKVFSRRGAISSHHPTGANVILLRLGKPFPSVVHAKAPAMPGGGGRKAPPPSSELSTIDFAGDDISPRALAEYANLMDVQEVGGELGSVYEEAAVLYANGNAKEAEALLEAVLKDDSSAKGEGLWMMLLDLYELTGQRERFESKVLDYATRFERSPPPWRDLSNRQPLRKNDMVPLFSLSGALEAAGAQLAQLAVVARRAGTVRIDLGRVRSCDEAGCRLLLNAIRDLSVDRVKVSLVHAAHVLPMLQGQIESGRREGQDVWLLVLELLQHTGELERFEELALEYAITFEESPPSWAYREPPPAQSDDDEAVEEAGAAGVCLEGDLTSANSDSIRRLAAFAADNKLVEVECMQLRRLDFVSAGTLFNVLSTLQAQGSKVKLKNVNAMVAALLRVMGVDQVAQVMVRR